MLLWRSPLLGLFVPPLARLPFGLDQGIEYALRLGDVAAANSQREETGFQAFDQDRVHALARRAGTL